MDADFPAAHSMDTRWFAVDQVGHIAMFDSGENGHVPESATTDDLFLELWRLRHPTETEPELDDDWEEQDKVSAEQLGVFYFSYSHDFEPIGTYGLWVAPPTPLHVDRLPPVLRKIWTYVRFEEADFTKITEIQPLDYERCVYWYEEIRVAYICGDGKTVRPIPGMEDKFAQFCKEFREANPQEAQKMIFEAPEEKVKKPSRRRRKENDNGK